MQLLRGLKRTSFGDDLIRHNNLDKHGFTEWIFSPGMLFNAEEKWWGNGGTRCRRHEGLDIHLYRDKNGENRFIDKTTVIPAAYDGEVLKIADDFLGKSVYIIHDILDRGGNRLCTVYGHTSPHNSIDKGKIVKEGEIIASVSDISGKKTDIPAHLHISIVWLSKALPQDSLNWDTMNNPDMVTLIDPLLVIEFKYTVIRNR